MRRVAPALGGLAGRTGGGFAPGFGSVAINTANPGINQALLTGTNAVVPTGPNASNTTTNNSDTFDVGGWTGAVTLAAGTYAPGSTTNAYDRFGFKMKPGRAATASRFSGT